MRAGRCAIFAMNSVDKVKSYATLIPSVKLSSGMSAAIYVEQMGRIHGGVNLRGGKAGVAQQFLQTAQIRAARQQMGGKTMAQSMGRGAFR